MARVLAILLVVICIALAIVLAKYIVLRMSINEIKDGVDYIINNDTNTSIRISSSDKYVKNIAVDLNKQLKDIRNEKLLLHNKNNEIKQTIANISHDLRTPLTAINGYLDLLEMEDKSEEVTKYLDIIKERTNALKKLTDELFEYSLCLSTSAELEIKSVSINKALEVALTGYYGALMEHNMEPVIEICEEEIIRKADYQALQRVFSNILNNVIKYSDGDFKVTLSKEGVVTFSNRALDMDNVNVNKLFDRFFTVENARGSTGLGLSIAKILVSKMNGTIDASYSEEILSITIDLSK